MTDHHPIPPQELVQKWCKDARGNYFEIILKAAAWGYQQCDASYERAAFELVPPTWLEPLENDD